MQILTDLNTKLLKTVNVNVLESNYKRKIFYEIENVVKDSGEGWLFYCRLVRGSNEKAILEPLASALAERLFYISDIITSWQKPKKQ
jgi:hypothetical protein